MSNNQFTTTRFPVRTIPLVTTPRRRFVELLAASVLGAALALFAAWLLFVPAPTPAPLAAVPAPILIMATAALPPVAPTSYPTPTAAPIAVPAQEPISRAEPIQARAPALAQPTWFPTTVAADCYSGCDGGIGPVDAQPTQGPVPTSEVFNCTSGCNQVWTSVPAPDPATAPTSEVTVICPPAPCPDPPDLEFAATIQALPTYSVKVVPPVQPVDVNAAGKAGA